MKLLGGNIHMIVTGATDQHDFTPPWLVPDWIRLVLTGTSGSESKGLCSRWYQLWSLNLIGIIYSDY